MRNKRLKSGWMELQHLSHGLGSPMLHGGSKCWFLQPRAHPGHLLVAMITTQIGFVFFFFLPPKMLLSQLVHNSTATLPYITLQFWYCCSNLRKELVGATRSKAALLHSGLDLLSPLVHKSEVTTHVLEDKKLWWITETVNYIWKGHSFFGNPIKLASHVDSTSMNMNQRPLWPYFWNWH